jgi:hypothetical protein
MPTEPKTFRSSSAPHDGHVVRAASLNAWTISSWWPQALQRYS